MTTETMTAEKLAKLEEFKKLLGEFSVAEVKTLLATTIKEKPTLLSLTMDAIVAAALAGDVITDNVAKAVTAKARECGVLKEDESATQSSVATLIRQAQAYDSALKRAGLEIVKATPADESSESEKPADESSESAPPEGEKTSDTGESAPPADPAVINLKPGKDRSRAA